MSGLYVCITAPVPSEIGDFKEHKSMSGYGTSLFFNEACIRLSVCESRGCKGEVA